MHGSTRSVEQRGDANCHAQAPSDLHHMILALTIGGEVPPVSQLAAPDGSEATPSGNHLSSPLVPIVPLGPPPRS